MFKFYINGTELRDEPLGFDKFEETLERDEDLRGLLLKYNTKLTFIGDGYKILYDALKNSGYCPLQELEIQYRPNNEFNYKTVFKGNIRLTAIRFNLNKQTAEAEVEDSGWGARVKQNKNIKASIRIGKSKKGVDITPASSFGIYFFNPDTGADYAIRAIYDIKDVFRFLIDFMTDGEVGFASTWLDSLDADKKIGIIGGKQLRGESINDSPNISFQEAFTEINKKKNICFGVETINGTPTIRIEQESFFYNNTEVARIENIEDMEMYFDAFKLYSSISVGSSTVADYNTAYNTLPTVRFKGFQKEDYVVQSECNIDKQLDLVSDWVIDSNVIQQIAVSDVLNDQYDDKVILVQYNSNTLKATQWTGVLFEGFFYNQIFTNEAAINNWNVQGNVAKYVVTNDLFKAYSSTEQGGSFTTSLTNTIFRFDQDYSPNGFDPGLNYGNGTTQGNPVSQANSSYKAQADGIYDLNTVVNWRMTSSTQSSPGARITVYYDVYDSSGALLSTITGVQNTINVPSLSTNTVTLTKNVYLREGDYVFVKVDYDNVGSSDGTITVAVIPGATFECVYSTNQTTAFKTSDPNTYYVAGLNFKRNIPYNTWEDIKAAPHKAWVVNNGKERTAWIKKITRNIFTTEAQNELITNLNNGN